MNIFAPKNYVVYIKENNSNTMLSPNISKWDDNSYVYYSFSRASSVSKPSIIGTTGYTYYEYEPKRDLLAQVRNHINGGVISQYDYENDAAGRRVAVSRSGSMMSETRTDYYGYNYRDELISATKNTEDTEYQYSYDDIGTAFRRSTSARTAPTSPMRSTSTRLSQTFATFVLFVATVPSTTSTATRPSGTAPDTTSFERLK